MNLKRIINRNNKLIILVIVLVIFVYVMIRLLNSYYEEQEKNKINNNTEQTTINKKNDFIDTSQDTNSEEVENEYIEVIDKFINYCNNGQISAAYDMLTDECKNAMFSTEEIFRDFYIPTLFSTKRIYSTIKWYSEKNIATYQVNLFNEDMLATGTTSELNDYFTVIKNKDGTYNINVNKYIYGEDKNRIYNTTYLTIEIGQVDIYLDYQEYEIKITNKTSNTISLSTDQFKNNVYLANSSGTTYSSINSVINYGGETLRAKETKSYTIKFNKKYDPDNKVKSLAFKDVILDYDEYMKTEDKIYYKNRTSVKIEF